MKVRIRNVNGWQGYRQGTVLDVPDGAANVLLARKLVDAVEPETASVRPPETAPETASVRPPETAPETAAVGPPETAMRPAAKPRRRG